MGFFKNIGKSVVSLVKTTHDPRKIAKVVKASVNPKDAAGFVSDSTKLAINQSFIHPTAVIFGKDKRWKEYHDWSDSKISNIWSPAGSSNDNAFSGMSDINLKTAPVGVAVVGSVIGLKAADKSDKGVAGPDRGVAEKIDPELQALLDSIAANKQKNSGEVSKKINLLNPITWIVLVMVLLLLPRLKLF